VDGRVDFFVMFEVEDFGCQLFGNDEAFGWDHGIK